MSCGNVGAKGVGQEISIIRRQHISSLPCVFFLFSLSFLLILCIFSPPRWFLMASRVCLYGAIVFRLTVEHASRESEKLRSDLQEANQRSSLLAQEVDENHAKQESIRRTQFK